MNITGSQGFDIVVISLRTSTERRRQAAQQLDAMGFAWSFQDGIDGRALATFPEEYDRQSRMRLHGAEMNPGQVGCFLSHREVWKRCVQSRKLTLALEDDFQFQQNLDGVLPFVSANLSTFDILRLQALRPTWKYKVLKDYGERKLVKHYHDPVGATAYFIKPECARVMLEKSNRFHAHVDDFFGHDWIHRQNILSLLPYAVVPCGLPSTIELSGERKAEIRAGRKWQMKVNKFPRSIQKRLYRMAAFPGLFIQKSERFSSAIKMQEEQPLIGVGRR
jgi:glycosyl transferase family 25